MNHTRGTVYVDSTNSEELLVKRLVGINCEMEIPEIVTHLENNSKYFWHPVYREVFEVCSKMLSEGKANYFDVSKYFHQSKLLNLNGWTYNYFLEWQDVFQTQIPTKALCYKIRENKLRRDLIARMEIYRGCAMDDDEDTNQLINTMVKDLSTMTAENGAPSVQNKEIQLGSVESFIQFKRSNPNSIDGLATFLNPLDSILTGFKKSDLIVIAARPSMGKTALAKKIALNMAKKDIRVKIFSIEMDSQSMYLGLLSQYLKIPLQTITSGYYDYNVEREIEEGLHQLRKMPLTVDDQSNIGVYYIKQELMRLLPQDRPEIIFIDYLGLMDTEEGSTREREVANTTKALKALAKQFDIPVVLLAQLNRQNETRPDKRPALSDLKDSGAIEADADVVMFIHRPEYYGIKYENNKSTVGKAEIIVAKHRKGRVGTANIDFVAECADFRDATDV